MEFKEAMIDVIRYLAAYTATEDSAEIAAARKTVHRYASENGTVDEVLALWDVTIMVQRYISDVGVDA